MFKWLLSRLFPKAPLPSDYIDQFLAGAISAETFVSNIGDGWIGSDIGDWDWLNQIYEIEQRYNPDFPGGRGEVWWNPDAQAELAKLSADLRAIGR